jgi:hypothetical protein
VEFSSSPLGLSNFTKALFRTSSVVSDTDTGTSPRDSWRAVVWIFPTKVPSFETLCFPLEFKFLNSKEARVSL